jgi:peptide/nickel transport system substrate-binding protein
MVTQWIADVPSGGGSIPLMFGSDQIGGGWNLSRFSSDEIDALIADAVSELDMTTAQQKWTELDRRILEEAPLVPLTYAKQSFLAGSSVRNHFAPAYPGYQNYLTLWLSQ